MIISSSRKPAPNTRIFCKNFSNAFGYEYVARGKSSIRDLTLKAADLGFDLLVLVYEIKGNPSKLSFFLDGEETLSLKISANTTNERLYIKPKDLRFKSIKPGLEFLKDYFDFDFDEKAFDNYIEVKDSKNKEEVGIISFYNDKGNKSEFEITIKKILNLEK